MAGNVFLKGAKASKHEASPLLKPDFDPGINLVEKADGWYLDLTLDKAWAVERKRPLVSTALLGKAVVPMLPFENPDRSPLKIDTDYFGHPRSGENPFPGPFEIAGDGKREFKVWPAK